MLTSIDWEEGAFLQFDRRCSFLNEEKLCDLYEEMGEEFLCRTCREYPRHTEEFENVRELSLSLSCPEAARIILECTEPLIFLSEETKEKEPEPDENFDFLMYNIKRDPGLAVRDRTEPEGACFCPHGTMSDSGAGMPEGAGGGKSVCG